VKTVAANFAVGALTSTAGQGTLGTDVVIGVTAGVGGVEASLWFDLTRGGRKYLGLQVAQLALRP
jgi:hypothetical protein